MTPLLTNTAGEPEPEARSRHANALEALWFACSALAVLWLCCYGFGILGGNSFARTFGPWPLALGMAWALLGSPFWHRDRLESLGLGNPARLFRTIRERRGSSRWRLLGTVLLLTATLFFVSIAYWPDTARLFRLGSAARLWPLDPLESMKMVLFSAAMSAFVATCIVRYDNFKSAFRVALIVSAALITYAGAAALLHRGTAAFERIDPSRYPLDVLAYVFWGGLQQFLFTAYFSTRVRKGFAPGRSAENIVSLESRGRVTFIGAAAAAALLGPAVWLLVRILHGSTQAPLGMLFWFIIFALPVGAVWTWFFCKDKKRMLVATLSGSFFGLIHLDSYGLVMVTFGLGTILAWLFMEDRYRNLSALAFIHGFLGSTFGKMFSGEAAGVLRVNYRVGPWSIAEPNAAVLVVPLLCVLIYAIIAVGYARRARTWQEPATAH